MRQTDTPPLVTWRRSVGATISLTFTAATQVVALLGFFFTPEETAPLDLHWTEDLWKFFFFFWFLGVVSAVIALIVDKDKAIALIALLVPWFALWPLGV